MVKSVRSPAGATPQQAHAPATASGWRRGIDWLLRREVEPPAGAMRPIERDLSQLFQNSSKGLVLCDIHGTVVACNPAAASLHDQPPAALIGRRFVDWFARGGESGNAAAAHPGGSGAPAQTARGAEGAAQRARDLDTSAHDAAALNALVNYDSLTGLPNRALFRDRLELAMERSRRSGTPMALMFLDLDRFKVVNDSLGHEVGDQLLKHVANQLTRSLRSIDTLTRGVETEPMTVSRLGGDEFTVIVESIRGSEDAALVAQRILDTLTVPFVVGSEEIVMSASIGISMFPSEEVDLDGLIRHTDMAMYRSKALGRGVFTFFSEELNAAVAARLSLENGLRRAIERDEFVLHYQPKVNLRTGEVTGVEALIRWSSPERGMVPPDQFISVLEDSGLILPAGAWVIRAACAEMAAWERMGLPPLRMAVNVSARQFRQMHFSALVEDTLRELYIEPGRLEIELTETMLMEDNEVNRSMFDNFARLGVRLAIDDFGTGYSSLSYLKRFKIDTLKIDRSFVNDLPDNADDAAIASAVVALAHSLQMRVVAEGVETERQADFLRGLGCDDMQGYLVSRPLPAAEFVVWLTEHQRKLNARRKPPGRVTETRPMPLISLVA